MGDFDGMETDEENTPIDKENEEDESNESEDGPLDYEDEDPNPNLEANKQDSKNFLEKFQHLLSQMENNFN